MHTDHSRPYRVEADIRQAHTLPANFYRDPAAFGRLREEVFARAWHWVGSAGALPTPGSARPVTLLEGLLDEPLALVRDQQGQLRTLSNVCTHRGHLVVQQAGPCQQLRCRYHGRRFGLDGRFLSMPEFAGATGFPRPGDSLPVVATANWGDLVFASLDPQQPWIEWVQPLHARVGFLPWDQLQHQPAYSREYEVAAHWALYVDNYLEGFHIPYVHPALNRVIDYGDYRYELFPGGNLQVGTAKGADEPVFDLPDDHPEAGQRVAAFYFWLFPHLMLNVYPWGVSLNQVEPLGMTRTRVRFETFVWRPDLYDATQRELLHQTELEDEAVVEAVQRGIGSRLYQRGRFSPRMEVAVHQFHRLLAAALES
ncbi:MAG: aromatic ring-hydroxylating dioxygenase subunit alpha [Bacteroidetes bacterium]|nr:MAG: aromatic ring-hydroxylating dioxygenase subunit alpha [Bacteroidota bacterium]